MELPITGYAKKLNVAPGETVEFAVSTAAASFEARLVKLHRDPALFEPIASDVDGHYPGKVQPIRMGSHAVLARPASGWPMDLALSLHLCPTAESPERQGVLSSGPDHGLFVEAGRIVARGGGVELRSDIPLRPNHWYRVVLTPGSPTRLEVTPLDDREVGGVVETTEDFEPIRAEGFRLSGWWDGEATVGCLDGKIARPAIRSAAQGAIAEWDMSRHHETARVVDVAGGGNELRLVQHPRRAVTGPAWDGTAQEPRQQPSHYDAIAFHSDDLTDAGWATTLAWTVPATLASGVYALQVSTAEGSDHLPFLVTPGREQAKPRCAFLAPTFSYLAYGNERHWWHMPNVEARTGKPLEHSVTAAELWAAGHGMLSPYDRHRDGTGCTHASWLHPIVNFRAGYHHPYIGGPHQLSADLLILDWLDGIGEPVDVVTDHDLHVRGAEALRGYAVVMTGSHPEYVSAAVLDALDAFNRQGGSLVYFGGNGFYCAVSTYPDEPHVMELRRGHTGGSHWKSPPGEAHHASTGELGGKWKLRDRSAHRLFGVGTSSVTFDRGSPYVRTEASHDPAYAWVFDGVEDDVIDTESCVLGQPGGFEYDRMDPGLGTPADAVCLAVARFDPPVTEYLLDDGRWTGTLGENRADLVLIPGHGRRGDIFSVGSIAWTGCLLTDDGANKVATITGNVLRRFAGRGGADG
ncbi:N,N-dimethylformamidase beta subunit family domain-containing protein [Rhizorhabdus histidinilytica]|uniref:N,N-dimethylformamidase beta subunit family domain-containing protein n=1 Tax=Rhizorhabdus histidinilytica TaxID=439228 RepID=UPI00321FA814